MIVVIIAGGSGTRLWPLSTPAYPKHLLKINGDDRSLLQHTYDRAKQLTNDIYVVSEAGHIQHVKEQLPDLSDDAFVVEPARRGTASCIVAALAHISSRHDSNEPIASVHADHYIRDVKGFAHSFKVATKISSEENRIVLVGVEPDYPATGFGYIQKGTIANEARLVYNVNSFTEKPDYRAAKRYVQSGNYLWNCGYFVGSVSTFIDKMKEFAPELYTDFQRLAEATPEAHESVYMSFENQAIDYALIEKVKDLLVVPAAFDWLDLGSFADLAKAVGADEAGNALNGKNIEIEMVHNSFIHNGEDKPIALIGLDNIVVINTPDGILITRKDMSQKVGEVSKRITAKKVEESVADNK
jgi:mannose-1-phosphate guanylyltransferase